MFDQRTALEAILYVLTRARPPVDLYTVVKTIYFADLLHLQRYGRFMFGDSYIAMKDGPVPSNAYDYLRPVLNAKHRDYVGIRTLVEKGNDTWELRARREPNMDFLSKSEVECLDEAIDFTNKLPSFGAKKTASHGTAWKRGWDIAIKNNKKSHPIAIHWLIDQIGEESGPEWVQQITEYIEEYV